MASTIERIESSSKRSARASHAFGAMVIMAAILVAFLVGRMTASTRSAHASAVRPVHLTASLRSDDGFRRVAVMRKMNTFADAT